MQYTFKDYLANIFVTVPSVDITDTWTDKWFLYIETKYELFAMDINEARKIKLA